MTKEDVAEIVQKLEKAVLPVLMKENETVVNAVKRYAEDVQAANRRMTDIELLLGDPHCPTCGRSNKRKAK